ncbi:DALR anticodon-binding domain-containing protein [Streptomyces sp. NPDC057702]|uniref:DALR anticodon-binding domain-containing protein n=1 Tax=unclassified Streptomyces TaxID=2593676 RepID=UPI00367C1755
MTPAQLSRTVVHVVRSAVQAGELSVPAADLAALAAEAGSVDGGARRGIVRVPPRAGRGDFASPLALRLAAVSGQAPREVAEVLRRRLARQPGIARVEVAGPGFVNITVADGAHAGLVREVLAQGTAYGRGDGLAGTRLRLRPGAGPRAGLFAEVIARLVTACGAEVETVRPVAATDHGRPTGPRAHAAGPAPDAGRSVVSPATADATEAPDTVDGPHGRGASGARHAGAVAGSAAGGERVAALAAGRTGAAVDDVPRSSSVAVAVGDVETVALSVREPGRTLEEWERELGRDGARWALLHTAAHDLPRCAPETVLAQRESNPLFQVRYAHARARALLRNGRDLGVLPSPDRESPSAGEAGSPAPGESDTSRTGPTGPDALRHDGRHPAAPRHSASDPDSEAARRHAGHPEAAHRDRGHSETAHPETAHSNATHPEAALRDATHSEAAPREATHSEAAHRDATHPHAGHPEAARRDRGHSETAHPETAHSNATHSEAALREATHSEAALREATHSEAALREATHSEAAHRDATHPHAAPSATPRRGAGSAARPEAGERAYAGAARSPADPAPRPRAGGEPAGQSGTGEAAVRARAALLGLLADYPRVVEEAARRRAPDRLARELEAVADAFFRFHDTCPPLPRGEEKPSAAHRARLAIAEATGTVLASGLNLLGISAPAHL